MGTYGSVPSSDCRQYRPEGYGAAAGRPPRPLESKMKSISLGVASAVMIAAAVAAACGGSSSGDWEPQTAAVQTTAQVAALETRHTGQAGASSTHGPAASPVDAQPLEAAAVATKPVYATVGRRVQVVGTAGAARGRVAMVAVGTAAPVLLKEGDSIEGESLLRIGVDYIVLGRLGRSRTIRVGVEIEAPEAATAASAPSVMNTAPLADARSSLASNRAFEQMLSQRQRRASP